MRRWSFAGAPAALKIRFVAGGSFAGVDGVVVEISQEFLYILEGGGGVDLLLVLFSFLLFFQYGGFFFCFVQIVVDVEFDHGGGVEFIQVVDDSSY